MARLKSLAARTWWGFRGIAIGLAGAAILYGAWLGADRLIRHPSLSLRQIEVTGCRALTPEAVTAASGLAVGEPLLYVDLRLAQRRVLGHPWVSGAVVTRRLPDTVSIAVEERSPMAAVPGADYSVVDREGVILWKSAAYPGKLPLVTGVSGGGEPGQRVSGALRPLRVLECVSASGFLGADRVSEVAEAGDGRVLVSLVGSGTVLIMTPQGAREEIRRLGALMEADKFDAQAAGYDLRFAGRVVQLPDRENLGTGGPTDRGGRYRHGQG